MPQLKVYSISLGCPKNRVDTETMLGSIPNGTQAVATIEEAELVLINTCSFIQPAVEESVRVILETAELVNELSPKPKLAVAGCLAARYGDEIKRELPEVDLWPLPDDLDAWPGLITQELDLIPSANQPKPSRILSTPPGYAYVKIGEGCNHACRYCTIPSIRGKLRSLDDDYIVTQSRQLLDSGVSELILVAQDLTAHGKDLGAKHGLRALLEKLLPQKGLEWLRLMYLYPSGLSMDFLKFLRDAGAPFIPYFDIPFQHVHADVLKSMGRPKSAAPDEIIDRVRSVFPEAAIRTTFIVGYPGETKEHYNALLQFMARHRLHHVGVFPYWPEDGTPAATMDGAVPHQEKEKRRDALMELQREISAEILENHLGDTLDLLVDATHEEWPGLYESRAWFQAPEVDGVTYVSGPDVRVGNMVRAEIVETKEYDLVALA